MVMGRPAAICARALPATWRSKRRKRTGGRADAAALPLRQLEARRHAGGELDGRDVEVVERRGADVPGLTMSCWVRVLRNILG